MPQSDVKSDLRRKFRAKRDNFVANLKSGEAAIAFSCLPSPLAQLCTPGKIVAGYVAIGSEADPAKLLSAAAEQGCTLALPYVTSKTSPMRFLQWKAGDPLENGPFGLSQPKADAPELKPDIVLVPLVAFDARLMRLGQGAGHYDRVLSVLGNSIDVGIAWSVQQAENLPLDPWDMPLDAILTESSWISR